MIADSKLISMEYTLQLLHTSYARTVGKGGCVEDLVGSKVDARHEKSAKFSEEYLAKRNSWLLHRSRMGERSSGIEMPNVSTGLSIRRTIDCGGGRPEKRRNCRELRERGGTCSLWAVAVISG